MKRRAVQTASVVNGLSAGLSGSLAAVIQQSIGNWSSGSVLSIALGGAVGAYVAIMFDVIRYWCSTRWRARQTRFQPSYVDEANEGNGI